MCAFTYIHIYGLCTYVLMRVLKGAGGGLQLQKQNNPSQKQQLFDY